MTDTDSPLNDLAKKAYATAREHGFWEHPLYTQEALDLERTQKIVLIHCELSEAVEELRKPKQVGYAKYKVELADVLIRLLDLVGREGFDFDAIVRDKMEENSSRPYKHDKAF